MTNYGHIFFINARPTCAICTLWSLLNTVFNKYCSPPVFMDTSESSGLGIDFSSDQWYSLSALAKDTIIIVPLGKMETLINSTNCNLSLKGVTELTSNL